MWHGTGRPVHLLTDAKAERTVVMAWRDTWRNECYELG